jgi:transcription-repair coupling factor (superfamily II helicase)
MLPKGYIPSDARRIDAYRRISQAHDFDELEKVRQDLTSAYGELPRRGDALFQLAEIRLAAAVLGIKSIARHEQDVIFIARRPRELEAQMRGVAGTLRMVGDVSVGGAAELYFRPPPAALEADTLLTILRRRLRYGPREAPAEVSAARAE